MREEIKVQEREQVETLANRLQSDLALLAVQGSQTQGSASAAKRSRRASRCSQQLRSAEPTGRLVIDLDRALRNEGSEDDIQLRNGDVLLDSALRQYVTVIGEVQNATAHVWKSDLSRDDYIAHERRHDASRRRRARVRRASQRQRRIARAQ